MTHIAISEHRDGTVVEWMEQVSDEQYNVPLSAQRPERPADPKPATSRPSGTLQPRIAPGLATLTDDVLFRDVWNRPELSPRDRSLVTVSALDIYDQVYTARQIDTTALRTVGPRVPAPASEGARARSITEDFGTVAPKFTQLTNEVVFEDLWRRSDLSPRDRSLVTLAALAAMGDDDRLDVYLRRGLESGLTRARIIEAFTHLGFYAGWPKATKAIAAVTRSLGR